MSDRLNLSFGIILAPIALIIFFLVPFRQTSSVQASGWYNASWQYRKVVTINHNLIASSTGESYVNFPVLVKTSSDTSLAQNAQNNGNDILFTLSDGVTKLNHEIESYSSSTGALVAWVNVGTGGLSTSTDTQLYMYFGNSSATNQQNAAGVWDSNYNAVYHLGVSAGGALNVNDSTANANNGINSSSTPTAGLVGGGALFSSASSSYVTIYNTPVGTTTIEGWYNQSQTGNTFYGDNLRNIIRIDGGNLAGLLVDTNGWEEVRDTAPQDTNTWHFVALTISPNNQMQLFKDGVSLGTHVITTERNFTNYPGATIGIDDTTQSPSMNGTLDEWRVSNVVRSADWIGTEYNNESNPTAFAGVGSVQNQNGVIPAVVSFSASPLVIATSGASTLSWNVTNASSVAITPGGVSTSTLVGSITVSPTSTVSYLLTATSAGGTATSTVTVTVTNNPPVVNTFTASPTAVLSDQPSTLSWNVSNALTASLDNNVGQVSATSGSVTVNPEIPTTYTLTVSNSSGTTTAQVAVGIRATSTPVILDDFSQGNRLNWTGNPIWQTGDADQSVGVASSTLTLYSSHLSRQVFDIVSIASGTAPSPWSVDCTNLTPCALVTLGEDAPWNPNPGAAQPYYVFHNLNITGATSTWNQYQDVEAYNPTFSLLLRVDARHFWFYFGYGLDMNSATFNSGQIYNNCAKYCGGFLENMTGAYIWPQGFIQGNIMSNQNFDSTVNRLSWSFNSDRTVDNGLNDIQIGMYAKDRADTDRSNQGDHPYNGSGIDVYAGRIVHVIQNRLMDHDSSGINAFPEDYTYYNGDGNHYWDALTRWYFSTGNSSSATAADLDQWSGSTLQFNNFQFYHQANEPEGYVGSIFYDYTGNQPGITSGRYDVSWEPPVSTFGSYELRYSTSDLRSIGFSNGSFGGTVPLTNQLATEANWHSPNVAEAPLMYIGIRPTMEIANAATGPDGDVMVNTGDVVGGRLRN
jgi:hypothetical protein